MCKQDSQRDDQPPQHPTKPSGRWSARRSPQPLPLCRPPPAVVTHVRLKVPSCAIPPDFMVRRSHVVSCSVMHAHSYMFLQVRSLNLILLPLLPPSISEPISQLAEPSTATELETTVLSWHMPATQPASSVAIISRAKSRAILPRQQPSSHPCQAGEAHSDTGVHRDAGIGPWQHGRCRTVAWRHSLPA